MRSEPLLEIDGLSVTLGQAAVVRELSLQLARGEMLGLVGESGCGKSVTALSYWISLRIRHCVLLGGVFGFRVVSCAHCIPK